MKRRILGLMLMTMAWIGLSATSAFAHLNVGANCTNYTIDAFWSGLIPDQNYILAYTVKLDQAGAPITVNASVELTAQSNGAIGVVTSENWSDLGITPSGTYVVSGSATLYKDGVAIGQHEGVPSPVTLTCQTVCTGSMGDFVWNDLNRNGIQDPGELGIPNITVQLWDGPQSTLLQSASTDENGLYLFSGLCQNTYTVVVPSSQAGLTGYVASSILQGPSLETDSNPNPFTVFLPSGATDRSIDFGFSLPAPHLTITKSPHAGTFVLGAQVSFTMVVGNDGGSLATTVRLSDQLPTNGGLWWASVTTTRGTCNLSASSLLTCDIGALWPGESATITVKSANPTPAGACQSQPNPHAVATADGGLMAEDSGGLSCTPPPMPCPAGLFSFSYDLSGNLNIVYDQFPAPNDNSYGVNAVGWGTRGHTFGNLTGSDKAGFQLRDSNGVVRLSFNVDYLSAKPGTPSGYGSLGVTGGDGSMLVGTADGIFAITSLDRNLNNINIPGLFNALHAQQFGSVNVLVNSPPTDAAHQTYANSDPLLAGWDFHDTYFVTISAAKLASLGFNPGTWTVEPNLTVLHNSPPKLCPPSAPTGPSLSITKTEIKDKEVKITILNGGSVDEIINAVQIAWPSSNGKLKEVKLDGDVIYSSPALAPPSATLTLAQLVADQKKRSIKRSESDVLKFSFEKNASTDLSQYSGTVSTSGFVLTILP